MLNLVCFHKINHKLKSLLFIVYNKLKLTCRTMGLVDSLQGLTGTNACINKLRAHIM